VKEKESDWKELGGRASYEMVGSAGEKKRKGSGRAASVRTGQRVRGWRVGAAGEP
jgi:hypothetical protein